MMLSEYNYSIPKEAIGDTLIELAKNNEKICVFSSDVSKSVNVYEFSQEFPDRFFEFGIAEQSTVSAAGGMAIEGYIPVYVALAIFSNGMTFAQTRQICNNNLNVKIIGTHAGVDDGEDGPGHHSTEDLAISRAIPRMTVLCPSDINEVTAAIRAMISVEGTCYMRVARAPQPIIHEKNCNFEIGKAEVIYDEGNDFAIIFEGTSMSQALEAWKKMQKTERKGMLISLRTIKPIDVECIKRVAACVDKIVTVENHSIVGGVYSAVCETLGDSKYKATVKSVGFPDLFMESGPSIDIKEKYGLSSDKIVESIVE